jgi:hypothetical protein
MRRRQIYAMRSAAAQAVSVTAPMVMAYQCTEQPTPPVNTVPRGTCRYCGKHIGQGRAVHERWCKRGQYAKAEE